MAFPAHRARHSALLRSFVAPIALLATFADAVATDATHADDFCASQADPCVVRREVRVADGADLDFGDRTLRLERGALLDTLGGTARVRAGRIEVETGGIAIRAWGNDHGERRGARFEMAALRRCSGDRGRRCVTDSVCAEVGAGACTAGDGSIRFDGRIDGVAEQPAEVILGAAGDVFLAGEVSLRSSSAASDGGKLRIEAGSGSVVLTGRCDLAGGSLGAGGELVVSAGEDVDVGAEVDARGGDFDGGRVAIRALRDVAIGASLLADSRGGSGFGGEIAVAAGRHLAVASAGASRPVELRTDGHGANGFGGDGGVVALAAGGDVSISSDVRLRATGAAPDGFGDEISVRAGGSVLFDGVAVVSGAGVASGGGAVAVEAGGVISLGASSLLDAGGRGGGGGEIELVAAGPIDLDGRAVAGAATARAGTIRAESEGDVEFAASWQTAGAVAAPAAELELAGCRVGVSGSLTSDCPLGEIRITSREGLHVRAGAAISTNGDARTTLVARAGSPPPMVEGSIQPPATIFEDPDLRACDGCRSGADGDEGCDDLDPCTTADSCVGGVCRGTPSPRLEVASLALVAGAVPGRGRARAKAIADAAAVPISALADELHVEIRDELGSVVYSADVPAGALARKRNGYRFASGEAWPGGDAFAIAIRPDSRETRLNVALRASKLDLSALPASVALSLVFSDGSVTRACTRSGLLDCSARPGKLRCRSPAI